MKQLMLFLIGCISFSTMAQSPWTKKKKEAYLQLSYTTISNYTTLFGDPEFNTEREVSDNTLQFFSEYGLTDNTTLIVNIPLKFVSTNNLVEETTVSPITTEDSKTTLGNIQIGLKHKFIHKKWLLTGQLSVEGNTSSAFEEASGLRTGYDAWTITPLLITGTSFNKWYLQGFTGSDIRTNDYSSSFKIGAEVGYKTTSWLWIAGFIDNVTSFKNGDIEEPASNILTGLYVNDQSYGGYGFKFIGEINKGFGANIGIGGAFSGENVAKTPAITFGMYLKI